MTNGQYFKHDPHPVYVGVTLDCTLSCKQHLTKVANKVKSHNNLLTKLACSSWGANANTWRSLALALCYSVAQYCCPVWIHCWCSAKFHDVPYHWDIALCTIAMVTSSGEHQASSSYMQSCSRQADSEDRPTLRLTITQICVFSFLQLTAIMQTPLDRHSSHRHHQSMARWQEVGLGGQLFPCGWPHYPATRIPSATTILVKNKPFSQFFGLTKITVHPAIKSVALQQVTGVSVANVKQCFTSSTAAHRPSWRVVHSSFTWLKQEYWAEDAAVQWLMSHGS